MLDAEFCETKCPVCTRARAGKPIARFLQKIEMALTGGGCPAGRARQKKYGVKPNEKTPEERPLGDRETVNENGDENG